MQMLGRNGSTGDYRYGFNGMEKDDEVKGEGNSLDFGARIYDPRIGRWLSRDAREHDYVPLSPYHFGLNNPVYFVDVDGNVIIDADGNEVTVKYNDDGNVTGFDESANLSTDQISLFKGLLETNSGSEAFKSLDKSETKITVKISSETVFTEAAEGYQPVLGEITDEKGETESGAHESATLVLYDGSMDVMKSEGDNLDEKTKYTVKAIDGMSPDYNVKGKNIKKDLILGDKSSNSKLQLMNQNYIKEDKSFSREGITIHEHVHLDPENIKLQKDGEPFSHEIPAYKKEYEYHEEKGKGL